MVKQILDRNLVSKIVGQPIKEFHAFRGSRPEDGVQGHLLALNVETASGKTLKLIYKSMILPQLDLTPETTTTAPSSTASSEEYPPEVEFSLIFESYSIETQFYQIIAPAIEKLSKESPPIPKFFYADENNPPMFLVMEDLRPLGYKMGDKFKGLSLPEVTLVMKTISKFHAQSYAVLHKYEDQLFTDHKSRVFIEKHAFTSRQGVEIDWFVERVYQNARETLEKHRGPTLADKMAKFDGKVMETVIRPWRQSQSKEKYFNVIIHGDLWINNVLFLYEYSDTPKDVKFIDFQQCRRGCIYDDLLYFLLCSTTPDFRAQNLNLCFETYFQGFSTALDKLGVPLPEGFNLDTFKKEFHENLDAGFCYAAFAVSFQLGILFPLSEPSEEVPKAEVEEKKDPSIYGSLHESESVTVTVEDILSAFAGAVKFGMENSEVAINRLESIVNEMVDLGIL